MVLSLIFAYREAKKAPVIDDSLPFLHDDYDENKDPTFRHKKVFCEHCVKNLDGSCNNGKKFGKIDDKMIELCKKEQFFEAE
jgi:hypothetical protein